MIEAGRAAPEMIVERYDRDIDACRALLRYRAQLHCGAEDIDMWTAGECLWPAAPCHWHAGRRYRSIHGPVGHLIDVRK